MRKSKRKKSPIWPYLGILACLFLLSLTAPRAWDRHARREPTTVLAHETPRTAPNVAFAPLPVLEPVELETRDESELAPRPGEFELSLPPAYGPLEPVTVDTSTPELETSQSIELPAPPYADQFKEETEIAHLPAAPDLPAAEEKPQLESPAPLELQPPSPLEPADLEQGSDDEMPATEQDATEVATAWPLPRKLLEQLTNLVHEDGQLVWSHRAMQLIQELCHEEAPQQIHQTLSELREIVERDAQIPPADASLQSHVARVRYSLTRWLDIWDAAAELQQVPLESPRLPSPVHVQTRLTEFAALAKSHPAGAGWNEFLKLDALREAMTANTSDADKRRVAQATLKRLSSPKLTTAQREFASQGPLAALREELQPFAGEPVDVRTMLANLDQFEYTGLTSDANIVAEDYRNLVWAQSEPAAALASHLNTHYRNANLRVAVSDDLANRLVPQPGRMDAPVRDTVVNVPVRGHSSTFTELSLRFVPDPRRIRLGLEAQGTVDANTISDAGPATFRNRGQSTFLARKLFVIGPHGLHVWPAIAEAENNFNYLISLETDYDGVPLVGSLVRNIARNQHDEMRAEARRQTEAKVAIRALHQLDSEVDSRLAEAEKKVQDSQLATLRRMGLELVPISLSTTENRVVARARLASPDQLGAHTPRPRAPSDSWFSMQVHQSAANNALEQLDLEGKSFELPQLFAWIAEKLGNPELANQEDLPEDVRVTFADRDAIRLSCVDDRIEVTFALAELVHEGSRWRNFQVRTHYAPEIEGLSPRFARVDTIHLDGETLRGKIQFKLRAIFSKVLSKNRDLRLLADSITSDPRFKGLQITQFEVEDGWIALAYSARRESSNVARRPE